MDENRDREENKNMDETRDGEGATSEEIDKPSEDRHKSFFFEKEDRHKSKEALDNKPQ